MRGHPRPSPQRLAAKLLEIRQRLGLSKRTWPNYSLVITDARISEYEHGRREPNLMVLLSYSHAARVPVEYLINDELDLDDAYDWPHAQPIPRR